MGRVIEMKEKHIIWNGEVVPLNEDQMEASPEIQALFKKIQEAPLDAKTKHLYVVDINQATKTITFKADA